MRPTAFFLAFLLSHSCPALAQPATYDLLLRNARIVDGSGSAAYAGEVAIRGDTIVRVARSISEPSKRIIDVEGQVVAPGFIDVHNHGPAVNVLRQAAQPHHVSEREAAMCYSNKATANAWSVII